MTTQLEREKAALDAYVRFDAEAKRVMRLCWDSGIPVPPCVWRYFNKGDEGMCANDGTRLPPMMDRLTLEHGTLEVQWPSQMTEDDWRDVEQTLEVWKRKVKRHCVKTNVALPANPGADPAGSPH